MFKQILSIFLVITSPWVSAVAMEEPSKAHTCKGHVETVDIYQGKVKDQLAFKPERSFYDTPYFHDSSTLYIDKAQLTINVQMDEED